MIGLRCACCGWFALLLVACDKQQGAGASTAAQGPPESARKQVRVDRPSPSREDVGEAPVDPHAALAAARRMEDAAERNRALAAVAWNAIELDPELASEAFDDLTTDSPDRMRIIQHSAMRRAEQDPVAALEWAESLVTGKEIAAAKCQVALVLAESQPERAANLLSEAGIEGRELEVAAVQVVQRWAASSPSGAAAWVVTFSPGRARDAGIRTVVASWMKQAPPEAFVWMSSLNDSAVRRETALAMAEALLQQPDAIRERWLAHADAKIRDEIAAEHDRAMGNIGDNVRPK